MTLQPPRSGPNNVAEYQASGLPWVTSSIVTSAVWRIDFPYVTNFIAVHAHSGAIRLGFTENGVNGSNYILLQSGDSYPTWTIRCKSLFLRSNAAGTGSISMMAGMTMIQERDFPILTGSAVYHTGTLGNVFGYGLPNTPGSGTGLG